MIGTVLRLIALRFVTTLAGETRGVLRPVGPYLRKLGLGLSLVISSLVAWVAALLFLLLALFFGLANLDSFIGPALWSGLVSVVIGIVLVSSGFSMLRWPR